MNSQSQHNSSTDPRSPNPVDLQVVGGGLAGLIAANLALDAGLSVRLIEKSRSLGGRAASADQHGFTLNQGPHALYLSGELAATLASLGLTPTGSPPVLRGATGSIGTRRGLLPQGPGSLLRSSLLSAGNKRRLAMLLTKLPKLSPESLATVTVDRWLEELVDDAELRTMLWGLVNLSTYNSASDVASADAALLQLQMALDDGVIYVDGGWASIVDALDRRLERHGSTGNGRFERVTGQVTAVETTATGPVAVMGDQPEQLYRAGAIVVAVGLPAVADRLLGRSDLAAAAGPPVQAAVLDLGLRMPPPQHIHLGLDQGLYFSTHSGAERMAPDGLTLVSLARYIRPGDAHSPEQTKAMLLAHADAGGIDRADIVMDRYLHRLTVTGGMPMAAAGGLAGRPGVAVPDQAGIFIAGDWVGPRGVLADASAASAEAAVERVLATRATAPTGVTRTTGAPRAAAPAPTTVATTTTVATSTRSTV